MRKLAALVLVACGSRSPAQSGRIIECDLTHSFPSVSPLKPGDVGAMDLSPLAAGHNAFALGNVGSFGQHYRVYFHSLESNACDFLATDVKDAAIESCIWGGLAERPKTIPPVPAEAEPLARALVSRAAASCEGDHGMEITWSGAYRKLVVYEIIPRGVDRGAEGIIVLGADEALGKIVTVREAMTSDDGHLSVPKDARWLKVPFDDGQTLVTRAIAHARSVEDAGDAANALATAVLEAARAR